MRYIFVARNNNNKWCTWISPYVKGEIKIPVSIIGGNLFHEHTCYTYIKKHAILLSTLQKIPYERIIIL